MSPVSRSARTRAQWMSLISPPGSEWRASLFRGNPRASPFFLSGPLLRGNEPHMVYEVVTTLEGAEVLRRAKRFFAERVPLNAAYPEREGPSYLTLRGQGGEEIAFAVWPT